MPLDRGKNGFALSKLPYAEEALAPIISAKTISFHYGKHHKAYVDTLNELIEGTAYAQMSLEDIVKKSAKDEKAKKIFNNAGQAWNHDFYWQSMIAKGGAPAGEFPGRHNGAGNILFVTGQVLTMAGKDVVEMDPASVFRGRAIFPPTEVVWCHDPALVP